MNEEYMPKPRSSATELVVQTPRIRIMRMSTSGWSLAASLRTQKTRKTRPARNAAAVLAETQCQTAVSLTAISTSPSPSDISSAPVQFTRPGAPPAAPGPTRGTPPGATPTGPTGGQKNQGNEGGAPIGPASTP